MENSVDTLLTQLVNWFEEAEAATDTARANSERGRDYYDGKQTTSEEERTLNARGQPIVVNNRVKRKINFLTGLEKANRTDPRAFPRNPEDEGSAEAATDAIRFVCDMNDFEQTVSQVWENMLVEGFGGCEIRVEYPKPRLMETTSLTRPEPKIVIDHWQWDRLGYDPHSSRHDFSDARYIYGIIWKDLEDAKARWPNAEEALENTVSQASQSDTYDDKPKHNVWADTKRKRVKIVQMYYRMGGKWHWCVYTKGGKLAGGEVPYVDEEGETECPMILASLYVDRENNRYGEVRDMIDPQDEINKRRSKLLHQLNVRQVVAEQGAVEDLRKAQQELAKPDGAVEILNPNARFEILTPSDQIAGQFQLLQHASAEMDMMGPNAAMQGKDPREQSGRAILAQQQGGATEAATPFDRLRYFRLRVYRAVWNRVRQYWTAEKWVRVTDDENKPRFVGLNMPVTVGQMFQEELAGQGVPQAEIAAEMQRVANDPRAAQIGKIQNNVAEMGVDIVVEEAPDTAVLTQEQFTELVNLAQTGVVFPHEVYIRASSLRNKDEILELLKGGDDPAAREAAAQQAQLEQAERVAEVEKTQSESNRNNMAAARDRVAAMNDAQNIGAPAA